jgi:hypothetical protein
MTACCGMMAAMFTVNVVSTPQVLAFSGGKAKMKGVDVFIGSCSSNKINPTTQQKHEKNNIPNNLAGLAAF